MSRNEDYLDNLLTSVTDTLNQFDDDFEQSRESLKQSYRTQNDLPPKTQSALDEIREDNFLREFEQNLQEDSQDDDFLKQFERELTGDDDLPKPGTMGIQAPAASTEEEGIPLEAAPEPGMDADLEDIFNDQTDAILPENMDFNDEVFAQLEDDGQEAMPVPEGLEGLEDIFSNIQDDDLFGGGNDPLQPETSSADMQPAMDGMAMDQPVDAAVADTQPVLDDVAIEQPADTAPINLAEQTRQMDQAAQPGLEASLEQILNESDDLLTEIENMEDGQENDVKEDAASHAADIIQSISPKNEAEEPMSDDPFSVGPDFAYEQPASGQADEEAGKKKKREKNPNSLFAKLSHVLFGSPEELNPELAAEIAAAKAKKGKDDPDNMDPAELKEKKKQEKALKKQQKKEEAEQKKQEKAAAKAEKAAQKAAKPKKEKKPKKNKELPKEPPLPKVPVIMMWVIACSIMVLVFLGASLVGYSYPLSQSKEAFDNGDYVTAYAKLQGIKVKEADEDLYHASIALAGVQTELNAYTALMEQKQYEMALDALVRGLGRCKVHESEAQEWGVSDQLVALEKQFAGLLDDQFNVSKRRARKLYEIKARSDYTLELHQILADLGLY